MAVSLYRGWQNKLRARRIAETLCQSLYAGEVFQGSYLIADEPTRYVVRVFIGQREWESVPETLPPWRVCVIVGVDKTTFVAAQIVDGEEAYRPILR